MADKMHSRIPAPRDPYGIAWNPTRGASPDGGQHRCAHVSPPFGLGEHKSADHLDAIHGLRGFPCGARIRQRNRQACLRQIAGYAVGRIIVGGEHQPPPAGDAEPARHTCAGRKRP